MPMTGHGEACLSSNRQIRRDDMRMVTVDATPLLSKGQDKETSQNSLRRGLAKLRGQGGISNTVLANGLENALVASEQHPDKDVAAAVWDAIESLLQELEII